MKIAANLSLLFNERPLIERIVAASAAGFDGVEIQFPYELPALRLKDALEAAGLPLHLINVPAGDLMSGGAGLAGVPARRAEFAEALREALTYAAMVRPLFVNVLPGRLAEGVSREHALHALADNLRLAADEFLLLGIRVLVEAINPIDMPGFLINTPEHLVELLDALNHPNLGAQLDLYHMARQGLDLPSAITTLGGRIGHVQFADCPGRGAPGSGEIDFDVAFAALREVGYNGWFGAEYKPDERGTAAGLDWLAAWRGR